MSRRQRVADRLVKKVKPAVPKLEAPKPAALPSPIKVKPEKIGDPPAVKETKDFGEQNLGDNKTPKLNEPSLSETVVAPLKEPRKAEEDIAHWQYSNWDKWSQKKQGLLDQLEKEKDPQKKKGLEKEIEKAGLGGNVAEVMGGMIEKTHKIKDLEGQMEDLDWLRIMSENKDEIRESLAKVKEEHKKTRQEKWELEQKYAEVREQANKHFGVEEQVRAVASTREDLQQLKSDPTQIDAIKELKGAGNVGQVLFVQSKAGGKAVYKPTMGTGLAKSSGGNDREQGDLRPTLNAKIPEASREKATDRLDKLLGFGVVPAVEKDVNLGAGSGHLQQFVIGEVAAMTGLIMEEGHHGNEDIHKIAAIDWITGNTDRHMGNIMRGHDGHWYAIDNGLAWVNNGHMNEYNSAAMQKLDMQKVHPGVLKAVQNLPEEKLQEIMEDEGFKKEDIAGAIARKRILQDKERWGASSNGFNRKSLKWETQMEWFQELRETYAKVKKEMGIEEPQK